MENKNGENAKQHFASDHKESKQCNELWSLQIRHKKNQHVFSLLLSENNRLLLPSKPLLITRTKETQHNTVHGEINDLGSLRPNQMFLIA